LVIFENCKIEVTSERQGHLLGFLAVILLL
jgi:hypothetical protein